MGLRMDAINPRRVVITGVGAVSPVGVGADRLFEAAVAGECGIKPLETQAAADVNVHVAGTVTDFDGTEHGLTKKQARRWERFVQYAIVASDEALAQSASPRLRPRARKVPLRPATCCPRAPTPIASPRSSAAASAAWRYSPPSPSSCTRRAPSA